MTGVTFSQVGPAVDASYMTGVSAEHCSNIDLAASSGSPGSIVGSPTFGVSGAFNKNPGQNGNNGYLFDTGVNGLRLGTVKGLSSTSTPARNFTGTVTFTGAATKAVTFGTMEADTSYAVYFDCGAAETFFATSKATTGFTANSSNSGSTAACKWILVR
jgi:hypothetical protein